MSEAESGWYVRHRDGVEHGPFRLADLVAAARAGNVASDTCVRHSVHTHGQWVVATRVQAVAQQMRRPAPAAPRPAAKPSEPRQKPASRTAAGSSPSAAPQLAASTPNTSTAAPVTQPSQATAIDAGDHGSITFRDAFSHEAFPVPKTFLSAAGALFVDLRFRRFITPWIIKLLWAATLTLAALWTLKSMYELFIQPSMTAPGPATDQGGWQFEPLADQPFLQLRLIVFLTWTALTLLVMMVVRVVCELVIVFIRVSGDLVQVREYLKTQRD